MVQHRGMYVRRISFISWDSIPSAIRDNMSKDYIDLEYRDNTKHFD